MVVNKSDITSIQKTAEILNHGGVVILPTDTVYGFSAKSDISEAEIRIRKIKGRSETKPFIHLISKPEDILNYTDDKIPENLLMKWPGPLTIIVNDKKIPGITTAFRCPGDEWLRKIIALCESPLYSTSVNRSGSPVIQTLRGILNEFESEVDLIVNGGDTVDALPSTIVEIENGEVKVIREGALKL
ncbi:MAG: threonylcarbamoyl-AMP synthase [Treponema sp.]|nr:threonylcarbamoyl-AMP synthase [Treponema sp.]